MSTVIVPEWQALILGIAFVLMTFGSGYIHGWRQGFRRSHNRYENNHTIPDKAALCIAVAQIEGRPALFHGGCNSCIWRHQNTTHEGIAFCRGCQYFDGKWSKPDKSISEHDLEKII